MISSEKPYGVVIAPHAASGDERVLVSESAKLDADRAMVRELRGLHHDPIGEQFGGRYYRQNFSFPEVSWRGRPVEVLRFYPDRGVALDVFETFDETNRDEVAFKRALFPRRGIRYVALQWSDDVTEVLAQIGLNDGKHAQPHSGAAYSGV